MGNTPVLRKKLEVGGPNESYRWGMGLEQK